MDEIQAQFTSENKLQKLIDEFFNLNRKLAQLALLQRIELADKN